MTADKDQYGPSSLPSKAARVGALATPCRSPLPMPLFRGDPTTPCSTPLFVKELDGSDYFDIFLLL